MGRNLQCGIPFVLSLLPSCLFLTISSFFPVLLCLFLRCPCPTLFCPCPSVSLSLSFFLFVLPVGLTAYLAVFLSACLSICLSACLSVCRSVCLSVCLSVCILLCFFCCVSSFSFSGFSVLIVCFPPSVLFVCSFSASVWCQLLPFALSAILLWCFDCSFVVLCTPSILLLCCSNAQCSFCSSMLLMFSCSSSVLLRRCFCAFSLVFLSSWLLPLALICCVHGFLSVLVCSVYFFPSFPFYPTQLSDKRTSA